MIDFHAHLDLYPNPQAIIRECNSRAIYVLSVTTTPSAWQGTSEITKSSPRIRVALGLHPQLAHQRKCELNIFDAHILETKYIGEIGMDGSPEHIVHWNDQNLVFDHILKSCTNAGGRILSIHSRRAISIVLDKIKASSNAGIPILHWFSGNKADLQRAINLNCWFSVGPTMLATSRGFDLVSKIPHDRILTETDGPFAQVDGRNAFPWDVQFAAIRLADLWKIPLSEIDQKLQENLKSLISLI
jgi:TatD DNase family protein